MNILIVAATEMEITPFLHHLKQQYKQLGNDIFFNERHRVQILLTGVGMVATTFALTRLFTEKNYDIALQAGVAGSYDKGISLAAVCTVKTDLFGDLGAEDHYRFLDVFELGLMEENAAPYTGRLLANPHEFAFVAKLPVVSALTVNSVTGSEVTAIARWKKYGCALESMEGAAFHYVCLQKQIPFLQVRAVSNYVEARDKSLWKMNEAVTALNEWMIHFLEG